MTVLLDSCVSGRTRTPLVAAGHDVIWAGDWPTDPGDEEILIRAHAGGRVLVTLDKDFGELAIACGRPHAGIVRLVGLSVCEGVLARYGRELTAGAIVTAGPERVRVRPPIDWDPID